MSDYEIITGDCLEVMAGMQENSVHAVVTDPPFYKVKAEAWDHQWKTKEDYINWIGELCKQWQRVLRQWEFVLVCMVRNGCNG